MALEITYPKSHEAAVLFLRHLEEKGFLKKVDGLYEEIPALKSILNKLFDEQNDMFKQYLKYKEFE